MIIKLETTSNDPLWHVIENKKREQTQSPKKEV